MDEQIKNLIENTDLDNFLLVLRERVSLLAKENIIQAEEHDNLQKQIDAAINDIKNARSVCKKLVDYPNQTNEQLSKQKSTIANVVLQAKKKLVCDVFCPSGQEKSEYQKQLEKTNDYSFLASTLRTEVYYCKRSVPLDPQQLDALYISIDGEVENIKQLHKLLQNITTINVREATRINILEIDSLFSLSRLAQSKIVEDVLESTKLVEEVKQ